MSESNRTIARTVAAVLGGRPKVHTYRADIGTSAVAILSSPDQPVRGVTSYSTVGLSDTPMIIDGVEFPARMELLGACASNVEFFAQALTTAALRIINDGMHCSPGTIFPRVIEEYEPDLTMRHLIFVPPFLWDEQPETLRLADKTVAWLHAVPIAEQERRYADTHGSDALLDLFEKHDIDIYDIERGPVVD